MRMGMLRPMNSNDMIRLSLGRPILTTGLSARSHAIGTRNLLRFRYATSAAIANPIRTSMRGISQRRMLPSFPSQISVAGNVSSVSSPSCR